MRNNSAKVMALGGIFAALAVVIMSMGTLIPIATFVCPMLCMLILRFILLSCGEKIAWVWFAAVAILCVLFAPDKESAAVFAFLGYYPILKPKFDALPISMVWKLVFFNSLIGLMYWVLLNLMGMTELGEDFQEFGMLFTVLLLAMGNVIFVLLDKLLGKRFGRMNRGR